VLASQTTGVALLRLADAEVLPFDYESYGTQILEYIGEIEQQAAKASAEGAKKVDFAGLRSAAEGFAKAGADVRARGESLLASSASAQDLAALNHRLIMAERDLIERRAFPIARVPPCGVRARLVYGVRRENDPRRARSGGRGQLLARGGSGGGRHPCAEARDEHVMAIDRQGTGLAILRICIGVFFLFEGLGKIRWLTDTSQLAGQLAAWRRRRRPDRGATPTSCGWRCRMRRCSRASYRSASSPPARRCSPASGHRSSPSSPSSWR